MGKEPSSFQRIRDEALALWNESPLGPHQHLSRLRKFAHFWIMVWRSFVRNRCPVRASALAYGTLLALVPMIAVVVSVTSRDCESSGQSEMTVANTSRGPGSTKGSIPLSRTTASRADEAWPARRPGSILCGSGGLLQG